MSPVKICVSTVCILTSVVWIGITTASVRLSPNELEHHLIDAIDTQHDQEARTLAGTHQDLLRPLVIQLLTRYCDLMVANNESEQLHRHLEQAERIARLISELSGDDYVLHQTERIKGWTPEQCSAKVQADHTQGLVEEAYLKGEYADTVTLASRAFARYQNLTDVPGQLSALHLKGQSLRKLTRYTESLKTHAMAQRIAENQGDVLGQGEALIDLGDVHERRKDHAKALHHYEMALDILIVPDFWREAGRALKQMGDIHVSRGDFDHAFQSYGTALRYAETAEDARHMAEYHDYLGYFSRRLGDYKSAASHHQQALTISQKIDKQMTQSCARARAYNHLGLVHAALAKHALESEDISTAEKEYKIAAQLEEDALAAANVAGDQWRQGYVLRALSFIARELAALSPDKDQNEHLNRSMKFAQSALSAARHMQEREWEGLALHDVSISQARLGKHKQARMQLDKAIQIWSDIGDLKSLGLAYRIRGEEIYEQAEQLPEALADYNSSIEAYSLILSHDNIAYVHYRKGQLLEKQKRYKAAEKAYLDSIQALESIRSGIARQEHKLSFFSRRLDPYEALVRLLAHRYESTKSTEQGNLAFNISERSRGRALLDLIQQASGKIHAGVDQSTLEKEQKLQSKYYSLSREIEQTRDPEVAKQLRSSLQQLALEYNNFEAELKQRYPEYAKLKNPRPITLNEVANNVLKPGDMLIEYFVARHETILFIVTDSGLDAVIRLPLGRAALIDKISTLRRPFEIVKRTGSLNTLRAFDLTLAHELYRDLVEPAWTHLRKAKRIFIVPHGPLFYLPFELLVVSNQPDVSSKSVLFGRFENVGYLLNAAPPISYALSASTLVPHSKTASGITQPPKQYLGIGNPTASEERQKKVTITMKGGKVALNPLPYAEKEVNEVKVLYPHDSVVYLRSDARKDRFTSEASKFRMILLSTHGIINEDDPMFSALVFARPSETNDFELLQTHEIFNLSLNAKLVALSACEVGLGKLQRGEGMLGLSRAFLYAGASSLLVTLWSIEDQSSSKLIVGLFQEFEQSNVQLASALQKSKLEVMHTRRKFGSREISYAHPFFWAPFILISGPMR